MAKAKEKKKKRRLSRILLWGAVVVVLVVAGAAAALYFLQPQQVENRLRVAQDFVGGFTEEEPPTREPAMPGPPPVEGEPGSTMFGLPQPPRPPPGDGQMRTHTVREGENLWAIARQGTLVDSPWEWRTILAQNKDKVDYAFVSEDSGQWKVIMKEGQQLRVSAAPPRLAEGGPVEKKYAVQLLSLSADRLERATQVVRRLLVDGQYAYLYRTQVGERTWYRVRAGFFETRDEAQAAAQAIRQRHPKLFPDEAWVMLPSQRELRGELLDFGAQRVRPWAIELPPRPTHAQALEDFRRVSALADFVYIAQKQDPESERFLYRTRLGFYDSREDAVSSLAEFSEGEGDFWADASVVHVSNFAELVPGQHLKVQEAARSGQS